MNGRRDEDRSQANEWGDMGQIGDGFGRGANRIAPRASRAMDERHRCCGGGRESGG